MASRNWPLALLVVSASCTGHAAPDADVTTARLVAQHWTRVERGDPDEWAFDEATRERIAWFRRRHGTCRDPVLDGVEANAVRLSAQCHSGRLSMRFTRPVRATASPRVVGRGVEAPAWALEAAQVILDATEYEDREELRALETKHGWRPGGFDAYLEMLAVHAPCTIERTMHASPDEALFALDCRDGGVVFGIGRWQGEINRMGAYDTGVHQWRYLLPAWFD